MSVDIFLPCIRFAVAVHPGDPAEPTDLEAAALHYLDHLGVAGYGDLEEFLGLGEAVVTEMVIRFLNRGWVAVDTGLRLHLSKAAKAALDAPPGRRGVELASTEDGRRFWICYDVIGEGLAVIAPRYLFKAADDARAVPRRGGAEGAARLYGRSLGGFAEAVNAPEFKVRILQALLADRNARQYLRGDLGNFHVRPLPIGRAPGIDDVWFYRCLFDVFHPPPGDEDGAPPILRCVETRSRPARKLGDLNAETIIEIASAADQEGDGRFLKTLRRNAVAASLVTVSATDPLQRLRELLGLAEKDEDFEDLFELWEQVKDRVDITATSQIDLAQSRVVKDQDLRSEIGVALREAREHVLLSSPGWLAKSPELSSDDANALSMLTRLTEKRRARLLVHGVRGQMPNGRHISDDVAVMRLATALGTEQVHVVSNEQDHLRTSFLLSDSRRLLFFGGSLFGDRAVTGLSLATTGQEPSGALQQLIARLPASIRGRVEALSGEGAALVQSMRPSEVSDALDRVDELLARASPSEGRDPDERGAMLNDLDLILSRLARWIDRESESVEIVLGPMIRDVAWRLAQTAPDEPLIIGIAGARDSAALPELRAALQIRLSRQKRDQDIPAATIVCLPAGRPEFEEAASQLQEDFGVASPAAQVRLEARAERAFRPVSFVATADAVLIAHEGLLQFAPTVGRRVKGTYLGLYLRGIKARGLAFDFIRDAWPHSDLAQWSSPPPKVQPWPVDEYRKRKLLAIAQTQKWYDDGNRGAIRAKEWIERDGGLGGTWSSALVEAEALRGGNAEQQELAYALMKGAAVAEAKGAAGDIGARSRLAHWARSRRDMIGTTLLAEHLPDDSIFRQPLVRKLAFCLARRRPPELTTAEANQLLAPSSELQLLSCLLMLDGIGGDLSELLAHTAPADSADPLARFTAALAQFVPTSQSGPLDLSQASSEETDGAESHLEQAIGRLRELAERERHRSLVKLVPQVQALHDALFLTRGAFVADLSQLLLQDWKTLSEAQRISRLRSLLDGSASDLGANFLAAARAGAPPLDVETLARRYYDVKHKQMQKATGNEPILLNLSGRYALVTLRNIIAIIADDLAPRLLGESTDVERALLQTARELLRAESTEERVDQAWLWEQFRERLRRSSANADLFSPSWLLPTVRLAAKTSWNALEQRYLETEFRSGTQFEKVVEWYLGVSSKAAADGTAAQRSGEGLLILYELLLDPRHALDPSDLAKAHDRLVVRLRQLTVDARRHAEAARQFVGEAGPAADLSKAADQVIAEATGVDVAIGEDDLESALLRAIDLLGYLRSLTGEGSKAMEATRRALGNDQSKPAHLAELKRLFEGHAPEMRIVRLARHYLHLGEHFRAEVRLDRNLRLQIAAGDDVTALVKQGASGLIRAMSLAQHTAPPSALAKWAPAQVGSAVGDFFVELGATDFLPTVRLEDGLWRVKVRHSWLTSMAFDQCQGVEFIVPTSREAEGDLREEYRRRQLVSRVESDRRKADAAIMPGAIDPGPSQILIALYGNETLRELPTLPWRSLAIAAKLPWRERRISALSFLSRQRLGSPERLKDWWRGQNPSWETRYERAAQLLAIATESPSIDLTDAGLARLATEFCLIFGISVARSSDRLSLSERGISTLCRYWPGRDTGRTYSAKEIADFLDAIVGAVGLASDGSLELMNATSHH